MILESNIATPKITADNPLLTGVSFFVCFTLQVFQILLMIFGVHAVEAYFLNPQVSATAASNTKSRVRFWERYLVELRITRDKQLSVSFFQFGQLAESRKHRLRDQRNRDREGGGGGGQKTYSAINVGELSYSYCAV